jgi:hypothetical protein
MSLALCKALSALSFWKPPSLIRPFSSSLAQFTDAGRIDKTTQEPSTADKETKVRARQAAAQEAYSRFQNSLEFATPNFELDAQSS